MTVYRSRFPTESRFIAVMAVVIVVILSMALFGYLTGRWEVF